MLNLPWLDDSIWFPHPNSALSEPDGLLCAGGDLSAERLILAYKNGIFPWYSDGQPILWWSPGERCILDFNDLHISKSMRRTINSGAFCYTFDQDFLGVINGCAQPRSYCSETWITPEMISAYSKLHDLGYAHSIEIWKQEQLIGGLYGISIGSGFFGESMFSHVSNASKFAFIMLAQALKSWGYQLFDCQLHNRHLESLGAHVISRPKYLSILKKAVSKELNAKEEIDLTWKT